MNETVRWADLLAAVGDSAGSDLEGVAYQETYRNPEKDGGGKKRILFSITLRSADAHADGRRGRCDPRSNRRRLRPAMRCEVTGLVVVRSANDTFCSRNEQRVCVLFAERTTTMDVLFAERTTTMRSVRGANNDYGAAACSAVLILVRRAVQHRFRESTFDDAAKLVQAAPLTVGVPGTDVLQLGHDLDQLLDEHGCHSLDAQRRGMLVNRSRRFHDANQTRPIQNGPR